MINIICISIFRLLNIMDTFKRFVKKDIMVNYNYTYMKYLSYRNL